MEDTTKHFIVNKLLEGFRRSKPSQDQRLPITLDILDRIISILPIICKTAYESCLFSSASTLAFHAFLRVGEFTTAAKYTQNSIINLADIHLFPSHINLHIRASKTDQHGRGTTIVLNATKKPSCPVKWISEFLEIRPAIPGPLFCHVNGSPLTRYQFVTILDKSIKALGLNQQRFKSHSFRIGAASSAALLGIPDDQIQRAGRWKTATFKNYIRSPF